MSLDRRATARLCRDRAAGYGDLRGSSLTAIALDRAAELLEIEAPSADALVDVERELEAARAARVEVDA